MTEQSNPGLQYLTNLNNSLMEVAELSAQARFCFSNLAKFVNEFSTDDLKEFVDAIATIEKSKARLEKSVNNHYKMMVAKPNEIVILD